MSETTITWLTAEQHQRLRGELDLLINERQLISARIESAREEGDLRENGGYHAAKEEQGKREARIRQLEQLLRDAKVGQAPTANTDIAGPGMVVLVRFDGGDEERFLIGSREYASRDALEVYSSGSPLGKALTGKHAGESATYTMPNGREMKVEILEVANYTG